MNLILLNYASVMPKRLCVIALNFIVAACLTFANHWKSKVTPDMLAWLDKTKEIYLMLKLTSLQRNKNCVTWQSKWTTVVEHIQLLLTNVTNF